MNWLDAILLVLLAVYAYAGWVHGFVSNLFSAGGLLLGFLAGIFFVPLVVGASTGGIDTALLSIVIVFAFAALGNLAGSLLGRRLRVPSGTGRTIDAVLGAGFGAAVVMAAAWAIGYAVSASTLPYVSSAVRDSVVLARVDSLMPQRAGDALRAFTDTLTGDVFPRYLDPFENEIITATAPPDEKTLALPAVRSARGSVTRILGDAECQRTIEGSGFVIADERVMTNAHVVAGVDAPTVTVGGRTYAARPVVFDPVLDLAVLAVPGLDAAPLAFDTGAEKGDSAAILGFPENGPFDARAARIRERLNLRGPDIYGQGRAIRDVFSVRGLVRSGNSGGPIVSTSGEVVGVVFAASVSDTETGYAVTAEAALPVARKGIRASESVSTEGCA